MGMTLIAYPELIKIQADEPTNKKVGLLWSDTDDGKLYASDGIAFNAVGAGVVRYYDLDVSGVSHNTSAMDTKKTYNISIPSGNAIILGMFFDGNYYVGSGCTFALQITEDTLGTLHNQTGMGATSETAITSYEDSDLKELEASDINLNIRLQKTGGVGFCYLTDMKVRIYYQLIS